jgi:CubicO group peptidase (beta-lactamase class C family)
MTVDHTQSGWAQVVALLQDGVGTAFPSAALCCGRGGSVTRALAVGDAGLTTWFDLASLTKALCTSVLCMQLVERGKLSLDEEVLPGIPVRALLGHVSGLPAWLPLFRPHRTSGGAEDLTLAPSPETRQVVVAGAAAAPRGPIGERQVYSDLGFILLGELLERRTGERLDRQFARLASALELEIGFRPLDGDGDAGALAVPAACCAPTRRDSAACELLQGVAHDDNARAMLGVAGHAGLFGTVSGVARLTLALCDAYHGDATPAQRALAVSGQTVRRFWERPTTPADATFGLGWDHPDPPGRGRSSAGELWPRSGVGHLGFTGCSLWVDPQTRTFAVLLTNRVLADTPAAAAATHAAVKALRPALYDAVLRAYGISAPS